MLWRLESVLRALGLSFENMNNIFGFKSIAKIMILFYMRKFIVKKFLILSGSLMYRTVSAEGAASKRAVRKRR